MWAKVLDDIVAGRSEPPPFVRTLNLPGIEGWGPGHVWGSWKVERDVFHLMGAVFGGYLAAIADSYTSLAMLTTLHDGEAFTTSDLRIAYFRPVVDGTVGIVSEVINRGRRQAHVEAVFVDERDKVLCKATATEVIVPFGEKDAPVQPGPKDGA
jgi:uncharacterized protein (TIGR00369 family)